MPISKLYRKSIAGRFSAAANTYGRHAGVQLKAASGLTKLIVHNPGIRSILEIGCGTGLFTAMLAEKFPAAKICAIDISAGMIRKAKEHFAGHKNIRLRTVDFHDFEGDGKFDLITSSSSLHWIMPLQPTFRKAAALLRKNGTFAFNIMLKGTLGELHSARRKIAPFKQVKQLLPAGKEVMDLLKLCGFKTEHYHIETSRSKYPSASHLLKALHEQGVTS